MSFSQKGVYLEMMLEQWDRRNLPDSAEEVADAIATTDAQVAEVLAAWDVVRRKFVSSQSMPTRIYNAALERTRRDQNDYKRAKQVAGAKGGNSAARKRQTDKALEASTATAVLPIALAKSSEQNREDQISPVLSSSEEREERSSLSPQAPSDPGRDPFTDPKVAHRAGRFIERYGELYPEHRKGARYAVKPVRDYAAAVTLCQTWPDPARLEKLAILFLTTDHRFAEEGSRTIPQFLALASWCDGKLAEWEAKRAAS
jgi:hypothetical protein